jgi:hypothetical protein
MNRPTENLYCMSRCARRRTRRASMPASPRASARGRAHRAVVVVVGRRWRRSRRRRWCLPLCVSPSPCLEMCLPLCLPLCFSSLSPRLCLPHRLCDHAGRRDVCVERRRRRRRHHECQRGQRAHRAATVRVVAAADAAPGRRTPQGVPAGEFFPGKKSYS